MASRKNRKSSKPVVDQVVEQTAVEQTAVETVTASEVQTLESVLAGGSQPDEPKPAGKAKWQPDSQDSMFAAVRTDKIVGRGMKCFVDTNVSDEELQRLIRFDWNSYSCGGAVRQARKLNASKGIVLYGPMVKAVRNDKRVGSGTGTYVEAVSDEDLIEMLKAERCTTPYGAVRYARSLNAANTPTADESVEGQVEEGQAAELATA